MKIAYFILIYLIHNIYCESYSFCGSNFLPKIEANKLLINSTKSIPRKRKTSEKEYIPINIIIDTKYLLYQLQNNVIKEDRYTLIKYK